NAQGRPRGRTQRQVGHAAQELRQAPEDATGQGRTGRSIGAGQEIRPGLSSLLRARPQALPPAVDCGDHRGARFGESQKLGRKAGLTILSDSPAFSVPYPLLSTRPGTNATLLT